MEEAIQKASVLIEALTYIQSFRDKIVVVKLGGSALEDPGCWLSLMQDLVFLEQVRIKPVVVHGGGAAITEALREKGVKTEFINGHRYTDRDTLEVVKEVLSRKINAEIVRKIGELKGQATAMTPFENCPLKATRLAAKDADGAPVDLGLVGTVTRVDTRLIRSFCKREVIPVIAPVARAADAEDDTFYNVNADSAASKIARALKAQKVVFLSDTHGVMADPNDPNSLLSTLNEEQIDTLLKREAISGGMIPKVEACLNALRGGVGKAHIVDGRIRHSLLLEIFTDRGIGTEVVHNVSSPRGCARSDAAEEDSHT